MCMKVQRPFPHSLKTVRDDCSFSKRYTIVYIIILFALALNTPWYFFLLIYTHNIMCVRVCVCWPSTDTVAYIRLSKTILLRSREDIERTTTLYVVAKFVGCIFIATPRLLFIIHYNKPTADGSTTAISFGSEFSSSIYHNI